MALQDCVNACRGPLPRACRRAVGTTASTRGRAIAAKSDFRAISSLLLLEAQSSLLQNRAHYKLSARTYFTQYKESRCISALKKAKFPKENNTVISPPKGAAPDGVSF